MDIDNNSLVTVYSSSFSHEIYLAKNKLELQGIVSYVFDDNIVSTIGTSFVDTITLKVAKKDFEEAKTVLSLDEF